MPSTAPIIFDCDGVLVDSEPIANRVMAALLNEHGYAITPEQSIARFVGKTLQAEMDMLRADGRPDLAEIIGRELVPRTLAAFERELRPVAGIPELLHRLAGRPLAVASGSTPDRLTLSLRVTGLTRFFDPHIYSSTLVANPKPAPDLFLFAAARLNVPPCSCVVVEDTVGGVQAALAAGMRPIGFIAGSHATPALGQRLREAGAAEVVASADELSALLDA